MNELSDAEVMRPREMTDAEVSRAPGAEPFELPDIAAVSAAKPWLKPIVHAFGQGFEEGFGPERLGISAEDAKKLGDLGLFAPPSASYRDFGWRGPFYAFNELTTDTIYRTGQLLFRGGSGLFRGLQAAGVEAGLPRDVVAMPEAFFGSPHPTGTPRPPTPKRGMQSEPPTLEALREQAAEVRDRLAAEGIERPQERPELPKRDDMFAPQSPFDLARTGKLSADEAGEIAKRLKENQAEIENKIFGSKEAADQWRKLHRQSDSAWNSGYRDEEARAFDRKIEELEAKANLTERDQAYLNGEGWPEYSDPDAWRDLARDLRDAEGSREDRAVALGDALRRLPREDQPVTPYDHWVLSTIQHALSEEAKQGGSPEALLRDAFRSSRDRYGGGHDAEEIVRSDMERLKRLLENPPAPRPALPAPDLAQARDLGVIGPERPPISEGTPKEAAQRTVAAARPDETIKGPEPGGLDPWQQRFEQFVTKLDTSEDVKQLIRDAARENNDFLPARQGDIPLRHVEDIAAAAGVDPVTVDARGLGRNLRNDAEVRVAMQLMLQATENVKNAARDLKLGDTPENLIKLQEAIARRNLAVEQVVGHRAEWGRTGNVFQEFLKSTRDEAALTDFLRENGGSKRGLKKIADMVDGLDAGQAAKFLNDANKPTFWDKAMWYWVNALISGPVTHAKYIVANATFGAYEAGVVTPIAGVISAARRTAGGREGVYIGEGAARMWGLVAGVPDALVGAAKAARHNIQTPLPGEVAQNITPKRNASVPFQQTAIPGWLGTAIGMPSRGASAIHSFFNFLGYRQGVEAWAYRTAAKEGLKPTEQAFWDRRAELAANPPVEAMNSAIEEGYRLTYITELGPTGKAVSKALHTSKVGRLILPFTHIPFNILSRAVEGTPLAFISKEARADLSGANGAVKQDMAAARLVAGAGVGVWAVNLVANDRLTGRGPEDQKERAQWLATGHQPYSIRIGDYWYSYNRFGSIGTMLGLYANLGEVMPHIKPDAEELTKALALTVWSTGRLLEDEVGMQGLAGLIEAMHEPERRGARFLSNFAGSWLPYSSLLRQTAQMIDPEMREAKTVVEGLRFYIPGVREGLRPKLDWLGAPIPNAYYHSMLQVRSAAADPVAVEMKALDLRPAPPTNRVGGIQLTPDLYAQYQIRAGAYTRTVLENWLAQPGWHDLPVFAREQVFRKSIDAAHSAARATIQAENPRIIEQGIDNRIRQIRGEKTEKKLQEQAH